jgi:hypothetical protein
MRPYRQVLRLNHLATDFQEDIQYQPCLFDREWLPVQQRFAALGGFPANGIV